MHGHFFAVVIQLARLNLRVYALLLQRRVHHCQVLRDFFIALFHWQLEVEDRLTAPAVDQPFGHQAGDAHRFFHHVTHQPADVAARRAEFETVFAAVRNLSGIHQAWRHRAVIHRVDPHAALHQLIGPAAGAGTKIDRIHAAAQPFIPLIGRHEHMECFFQLQRRAAWRIGRELQARNAHVKRRVVVRQRITNVAGARRDKEHMHHRTFIALIIQQDFAVAQAGAQRYRQLSAKFGQLFGFIGVGHFNAQLAALLHYAAQHADDRGNTIFRREIAQQLAHYQHLPGKNQLHERQRGDQFFRLFRLIALKQHVTGVIFNTRKTVDFAFRCFGTDFCRTLFLKSRTAIE